MRSKLFAILTVAMGLAVSAPLFAHHGAASFDKGKKVVLKGTVKEWLYSNPHCLLTLEVTGEDGKTVEWIGETQAPVVMYPAGYRKDTFKPGDKVTITVEPVKSGRPAGNILFAITADGTELGTLNSKPRRASDPPSQ